MDFDVLLVYRVNKEESERVNKNLDLAWELKKAVEQEGDVDTKCNLCVWNSPHGFE